MLNGPRDPVCAFDAAALVPVAARLLAMFRRPLVASTLVGQRKARNGIRQSNTNRYLDRLVV